MLLLLFFACSTDACRQLCASTAGAIEGCLGEWGASWEDLDATSRTDFGDRCRAQWDEERLTLELRQIDVANDQCTTSTDELPTLTCDQLRALYLEP